MNIFKTILTVAFVFCASEKNSVCTTAHGVFWADSTTILWDLRFGSIRSLWFWRCAFDFLASSLTASVPIFASSFFSALKASLIASGSCAAWDTRCRIFKYCSSSLILTDLGNLVSLEVSSGYYIHFPDRETNLSEQPFLVILHRNTFFDTCITDLVSMQTEM